jgi:hypothetical protein
MDDVVAEMIGKLKQPVIDEVMEFIRTGQDGRAVPLLVEREGHWLAREHTEAFVRTVVERMSGGGP